MSLLTPEEQVGFYREKGLKVLLWAAFTFAFAVAYYLWFGPYLRDATGRVNAILYAYYELFGIEVGACVLAGMGVLIALYSLKHFRESRRIQESLGNP